MYSMIRNGCVTDLGLYTFSSPADEVRCTRSVGSQGDSVRDGVSAGTHSHGQKAARNFWRAGTVKPPNCRTFESR